ncbi:hypothetical protein H9X75_10270, partial [Fusobacterium mortiferum]|uniref:hypothetical protein n=1 Tax=Fusobacterium mortiferum TaxID=850 RepID=UPI00195BBE72|nr:hypothetical protein [Fusobacterium mortiferum]
MDDPTVLQDSYPNTFAWMNTVISRHIGLDTSKFGAVDKILQAGFEGAGKVLTHLDAAWNRYEVHKDDNVFGPIA